MTEVEEEEEMAAEELEEEVPLRQRATRRAEAQPVQPEQPIRGGEDE